MEILILGGTGAMGVPLVKLLKEQNHNVYVTSRGSKESIDNLNYICGNAKDIEFLKSLLYKRYDAIFDFMVYSSSELKERIDLLLNSTDQLFFFSSSRVYADSEKPITETSNRLLDVCEDEEYLKTDEYALAKAKEENLLKETGKNNWTIIRPYITYNAERLQLGVYEKEHWLYRALHGRTIILPNDIAVKRTTLTYGPDVAEAIVSLIGNPKAFGEVFHIVNSQSITWEEILQIYLDIVERKTGKRPKVKLIPDSLQLQQVWNPWQIKYDRLYNRVFDAGKINNVIGEFEYTDIVSGLEDCLSEFLKSPEWLNINWSYEAWCDKIANERTPFNEISGIKNKLRYLKWRYFK